MAEIKFNITRMTEVHMRIDEMQAQLKTSIQGTVDTLTSLGKVIKGEEVGSGIEQYKATLEEQLLEFIDNLKALDAYLLEKINAYSATDQVGLDNLSAVNSILEQIGGVK